MAQWVERAKGYRATILGHRPIGDLGGRGGRGQGEGGREPRGAAGNQERRLEAK